VGVGGTGVGGTDVGVSVGNTGVGVSVGGSVGVGGRGAGVGGTGVSVGGTGVGGWGVGGGDRLTGVGDAKRSTEIGISVVTPCITMLRTMSPAKQASSVTTANPPPPMTNHHLLSIRRSFPRKCLSAQTVLQWTAPPGDVSGMVDFKPPAKRGVCDGSPTLWLPRLQRGLRYGRDPVPYLLHLIPGIAVTLPPPQAGVSHHSLGSYRA